MKENVTLNWKGQKRLMVLNPVEKGNVVVRESATVLRFSDGR
jgi:hypothetical protein